MFRVFLVMVAATVVGIILTEILGYLLQIHYEKDENDETKGLDQ